MGTNSQQLLTNTLLGQHRSHATEQSHRQSLATAEQHDQTQCPKPANKMIVKRDEQPLDAPNVHAVMVPMSQPVGGWHVTSTTKHPKCWKPPSPFSNVHFRNTTKILQHRFFTLNFLLILL